MNLVAGMFIEIAHFQWLVGNTYKANAVKHKCVYISKPITDWLTASQGMEENRRPVHPLQTSLQSCISKCFSVVLLLLWQTCFQVSFRPRIFHWNYSEDHLSNNLNNHLKIHYSGRNEIKQSFSNKQFAINYSITSNQKCTAWRTVKKNISKQQLICYINERNHVWQVYKMNFPGNPRTFLFRFGEQRFSY